MTGEKIYSYDLDVTGLTDFGIALEAILSGQTPLPPQGLRIDVAFAGRVDGRIAGRVHGTDFLHIRADGRMDLDIRAVLETDDGHRIALAADGVATPHPGTPVADLFENVRLSTASPEYAWVNTRLVWGIGTVDLAARKIHIDGYLQ